MQHIKRNQSGFTLVEIAIVLVIIGLLLGGVLKGQEIIENAKTKSLINDMKGAAAAFYSYQDRYKAIPGDDLLASTRFTGALNGNGNGAIAGTYATQAGCSVANETGCFWQHTRLAGFITGDTVTNAGANPGNHSLGGLLGVQGTTVAYGLAGPKVCAGSVPTKNASSVDAQLDDGMPGTGTFRANAGAAGAVNAATAAAPGAAATPYPVASAGLLHTVCMSM
ncbi:hypothetical protein SCT_1295 [Sulfuricella sp. T08]|uniref:prepilin-type N-terminal cleavage/methylation domain-containing protein n=1 Tax=Sulfuricella sp. T08 TaxID=1632857 RepID=UPI0006179ADA|nr:prepilin-type N-terminal cleavage/methylation domain-containing protein [Sulfuricella sp. T08]GAO35899.1 hypothetical protein SCT_1295 [Sulfuricella sp. T08]